MTSLGLFTWMDVQQLWDNTPDNGVGTWSDGGTPRYFMPGEDGNWVEVAGAGSTFSGSQGASGDANMQVAMVLSNLANAIENAGEWASTDFDSFGDYSKHVASEHGFALLREVTILEARSNPDFLQQRIDEALGLSSPSDLDSPTDPWLNVVAAETFIWGAAFTIASHNSKPIYQGAKSWAQEAKLAGQSGKWLGYFGLGITAVDMYVNGVNTSNTMDAYFGIVSFAGPVGAVVGGAYFLGNMVSVGISGKTIGEHVDENFYIVPGFVGGPPVILIPKAK